MKYGNASRNRITFRTRAASTLTGEPSSVITRSRMARLPSEAPYFPSISVMYATHNTIAKRKGGPLSWIRKIPFEELMPPERAARGMATTSERRRSMARATARTPRPA